MQIFTEDTLIGYCLILYRLFPKSINNPLFLHQTSGYKNWSLLSLQNSLRDHKSNSQVGSKSWEGEPSKMGT